VESNVVSYEFTARVIEYAARWLNKEVLNLATEPNLPLLCCKRMEVAHERSECRKPMNECEVKLSQLEEIKNIYLSKQINCQQTESPS
jgi:hypothetical protein